MHNRRVIRPPEELEAGAPAIFLNIPREGVGPGWQPGAAVPAEGEITGTLGEAVRYIRSMDRDVTIALPHRDPRDYEIDFEGDRNRRFRYLDVARNGGVIALWFPARQSVVPQFDYAADEIRLLGQLQAERKHLGTEFVVGLDRSFSKARQFRHDLALELPDFWVHSTLADVCKRAVRLMRKRSSPDVK